MFMSLKEFSKNTNVIMTRIKKLENMQIPLLLVSSFALIAVSSSTENMAQQVFADINFGAAGDWGCDQNAEDTVDNMVAKSPEKVFGLGDYSYQPTGNCWFSIVDPIDSITEIAWGNHEDEPSEGLSGYESVFGSQKFYSFNQENVHILVMDTDVSSYSSGSSQYNFVISDLNAASQNSAIDWIIVYLHKPFYTSGNSCSSSGCTNTGSVATELRNTYGAFFDSVGVDLVLQGHVHNYQRTFPLNYDSGSPSSPTIVSNNANTYTNPGGTIYAIVGTGGVGFHPLSGKASFVSIQQDDDFGQLDIKITNSGSKLEGRFYRNDDNAILDSFSITKVNVAPVANSQVIFTGKNTAKSLALLASDANNDDLTYSIVDSPDHGTLSGPTDQIRIYTPTSGYTGTDSFTFRANDGTANSNTATISITVVDPVTCPANLPVSSVFALGNDGSNVPSNVLDNNLNTRWSDQGVSYIGGDLGSSNEICSIDVAWYLGNQRQYAYILMTSTDGNTWRDANTGSTSQQTIEISSATTTSQKYFIPPTNARFFAIIAVGLTNTLTGITEVDIFGSSASLSAQYQFEPSLSLSGPPG